MKTVIIASILISLSFLFYQEELQAKADLNFTIKTSIGSKVTYFNVKGNQKKAKLSFTDGQKTKKVDLVKKDIQFLNKKIKVIKKLKSDKGPCSRSFYEIKTKQKRKAMVKRSCVTSGSKLAKETRRLIEAFTFKL